MNSLVALYLALVIDHLLEGQTPEPAASSVRQWRTFPWIRWYLDAISERMNASRLITRSVGVLVIILPPACLAGLLYWLLNQTLDWLSIVYQAFVLFVCLLPTEGAADKMPLSDAAARLETRLQQVFDGKTVILFWFAILGPFGAVFYRVLSYLTEHFSQGITAFSLTARRLRHALAWVPARIEAFIFALVGAFGPAFEQWKEYGLDFEVSNQKMLSDCAQKAVIHEGLSHHSTEGLLSRSLWVWLILLSIVMFCIS